MAAAIIPIIAAAAPLLKPVIKDLVLNAQKLFGHNNGTGSTKAQTVIDAAVSIAEKLSTAGRIPGLIDPSSIAVMVESIVQELKGSGVLPSDAGGAVTYPTGTSASLPTEKMVRITGVVEVL